MITTDRLILRPLRPEDAPWIAREIANPQVQRWLTSPPHPYTLGDAETFIAGHLDHPWYRVIEAQGHPCGVASVDIDRPAAELGYWLKPSAHGQGYMTEAAGALIGAVFTSGVGAMESGWIDGNGPSENVLTKLGFTRTGDVRNTLVRFFGEPRPVIRVRLTRDAWAARTLETRPASG